LRRPSPYKLIEISIKSLFLNLNRGYTVGYNVKATHVGGGRALQAVAQSLARAVARRGAHGGERERERERERDVTHVGGGRALQAVAQSLARAVARRGAHGGARGQRGHHVTHLRYAY
jgi:hypothetical protein